MFTVFATKEEVTQDFPEIKSWFKVAKKFDKDKDKAEFFYTYGFFVPKVANKEEYYLEMYESCSKMLYKERLEFELSKVRVNLTMKIGQFLISDRMIKGFVPEIVKEIVAEITKVKMLVEAEYHGNQEITNSIPEINRDVISFEFIKEVVKKDLQSNDFDIDEILDKISERGYDSLTDEERDFLDKKSKDL